MTEVYRNTRRGRECWSLREGGRIVAHVQAVALADVVLRASEASRLRCVRNGLRKEVIAWARGTLAEGPRPADAVRIGFRLTEPGFRRRDTGAVVIAAAAMWFEPDGSAWAVAPTASPEILP